MKKSAFIISKPLQYINASNIPDDGTRDCLLIDSFYQADRFKTVVEQQSQHWSNVWLFKDTFAALKHVIQFKSDYGKVYMDSDFGIILHFYLLRLSSLDIYTYEEGYASYSWIRKGNSFVEKIKQWIATMIGLGNWVGSHPLTRGMYLYQPDKFRSVIGADKPILSFRRPFFEHISQLQEIAWLFRTIDTNCFKGKKVALYLTGWELNNRLLAAIFATKDHYKVIKPHPHIREVAAFDGFDLVVDNYLPAEVLVRALHDGCESLTVFHEGTFAMEYFRDIPGVSMIVMPKV